MDIFQTWVNFWNPIAKPTADLSEEAKRKFQAGEITQDEYLSAMNTAAETTVAIAKAKTDYAEKAASSALSLDAGNVLKPISDLSKNLLAVLLIGGTIYWIVSARRSGA